MDDSDVHATKEGWMDSLGPDQGLGVLGQLSPSDASPLERILPGLSFGGVSPGPVKRPATTRDFTAMLESFQASRSDETGDG